MRFFALTLAAAALSVPAWAQDGTYTFNGYAYDLDSGKFLYTEVHRQAIAGERWVGGTIHYYAPDGSRIGHKTLDFSQDPYLPLYQLDLVTGGGYMEGIKALTDDGIEMQKKGYGSAKVRTASIKRKGAVVADSGFHSFLRDRFADLVAGKTVEFTFAVSGELDSYKFRARRVGDATFEGQPAVHLKVESATLLRFVAPHLEVLYEPTQRKLLEYRGISNLHDPRTFEPYEVRIIYPSKRPADAPPLPEGS
jgi:hypothetical protein